MQILFDEGGKITLLPSPCMVQTLEQQLRNYQFKLIICFQKKKKSRLS